MTIVRKKELNFLRTIKMQYQLKKGEKINVPENELEKEIFINISNLIELKLLRGEWTKPDYRQWKMELSNIEESLLLEFPRLFERLVANSNEENIRIAALIKFIYLKQKQNLTGQTDFNHIIKSTKSSDVVLEIRKIPNICYQVTDELVKRTFDVSGISGVDILYEELTKDGPNVIKEGLLNEYNKSVSILEHIYEIKEMTEFSRCQLLQKAVNYTHEFIETKREEEYVDSICYIPNESVKQKTKYKIYHNQK